VTWEERLATHAADARTASMGDGGSDKVCARRVRSLSLLGNGGFGWGEGEGRRVCVRPVTAMPARRVWFSAFQWGVLVVGGVVASWGWGAASQGLGGFPAGGARGRNCAGGRRRPGRKPKCPTTDKDRAGDLVRGV
jgi:hypothetical protein